MEKNNSEILLKCITTNPKVMLRKPTVRDYHLTVEQILEALPSGVTQGELIKDCPSVKSKIFRLHSIIKANYE